MAQWMRCQYCGLLQDEPAGVKTCARCGGELAYENLPSRKQGSYLQAQMELDQVAAPAMQNVERHLLLTLRTPAEVPPDQRPPLSQGRPPMNFCAVLDISGSMQGGKLAQAKQAVRQAAHTLRKGDAFALVTFNHEIKCPFKSAPVDDNTERAVVDCLENLHAGGTTALDGGLEAGIAQALSNVRDTNLVLLLSDGQTNVGEMDLEVIGMRALQARQKGLLVSALGVGMDYNEALLVEIATQGGGRFYHVQDPAQIPAYLAGELGEVAMLAARDVKIRLLIPPGATLVPLSAAYPVSQNGEEAVVTVGDIPLETELEIPLRLALVGAAAGSKLSVEGRLTFRSPAGHELETSLNRVTVRFMPAGQFDLRHGVVAPVVERVLTQMSAASLLFVSRTQARMPDQAQAQTNASLEALKKYASLLGEERAEQEVKGIREHFNDLYISPAASKQAVFFAHSSLRGGKDFGHKKS